MPFTKEQQLAIDTHGKNIIVSAGAGSGKTAVLTERIFQMLKNGYDISRLLVLTFTRAAALEMKTRIKARVLKSGELFDQLDKIDSAFITTFDSFSLSVVKKYHYVLGISKNVSIGNDTVIKLTKTKILDELMDEMYEKANPQFFDLLTKFTKKDDHEIRSSLLRIAESLEKIPHKEEYLNTYLETYYQDNVYEKKILSYEKECNERLKDMIPSILELYDLTQGTAYADSLSELLDFVRDDHSYEAILAFFTNFKFKILRNADEETKERKESFKKNEFDKYVATYLDPTDKEEMREALASTKPYVEFMIEILQEYYKRVYAYKKKMDMYEFNDIAMMSLDLVENYPEIQKEISESFDEILVDEYQDTSDIQETFIKHISHQNVYMVGDIKQSIYRFRNANPYIFKEKYDAYKMGKDGMKIDLNANFRSREEVLKNINLMFKNLMTQTVGDANYLEDHQMNYGNHDYDTNRVDGFNYNEVFLSYHPDLTKVYENAEIETFLMAQKIKELMHSSMEVYDKDLKGMRPILYSDIAIILDREKDFSLIRQIFTYEGIPLDIISNEKLKDNELLHIFNSLFGLVKTVGTKDPLYPFYFVSVARSFLFRQSDNLILSESPEYIDNPIYDKAMKVKKYAYEHSVSSTFQYLLEEFDMYHKIIEISNINNQLTIISYVSQIVSDLSGLGYSFLEIADHFKETLSNNIEITAASEVTGNGVQLMNIHKSKGLEYPICFFAGLYRSFNQSDMRESFLFDKDFGLITPYFTDRKMDTIDKTMLKSCFMKADISEKVRLFYVALTRAREKMYFILPSLDTMKVKASPFLFKSMADFVNYYYTQAVEPYVNEVSYDDLLTKDYLDNTVEDIPSKMEKMKPIQYLEKVYKAKPLEKGKISKEMLSLMNETLEENLTIGTHLHEILETLDLKTKDMSQLKITEKEEAVLSRVLSLPCFANLENANIYQELEFYYEDEEKNYHGIIDLLVEYEDHFEIIDYKLNNTDKIEYQRQLMVYYNYIQKISDKPIKMYLLSLIKATLFEVNVIE